MSSNTSIRSLLTALLVLSLAGCAREHEIDRGEFRNLPLSGKEAYRVDGEPFSGVLVYREGDSVRARIEMKEGRPHGWSVTFNEDGDKITEGRKVWSEERGESVWDGTFQFWNSDGQLLSRSSHDEGTPIRQEEWCEDGQEKSDTRYEDGKRQLEKAWDCQTGNFIAEVHYDEDGRRHGDVKSWSSAGVLVSHERYSAGQLNGLSEHWHPNESRAKRGEYVAGKPVGLHESWDESGVLRESGAYDSEGEKTGIWRSISAGRTSSIHYGPQDFIKPDVVSPFVRALAGDRANRDTVEFYLREGAVRVSDALPANYRGDVQAERFQFPVFQWTYPIVVANSEMLPILLKAGADINQTDSKGRSRLLRCAAQFRSSDVGRYRPGCDSSEVSGALSLGASAGLKDLEGNTALHLILAEAKSADRTLFGRSSTVAAKVRIDALSVLVKAGADPNAVNNEGHSPLTLALRARRADLAKALLSEGSKADSAGPNSTRAIHWLALESGNQYRLEEDFLAEIIPVMASSGASLDVPMEWDGDKVTIRDLAVRHGMVSTVRLIDANSGR